MIWLYYLIFVEQDVSKTIPNEGFSMELDNNLVIANMSEAVDCCTIYSKAYALVMRRKQPDKPYMNEEEIYEEIKVILFIFI